MAALDDSNEPADAFELLADGAMGIEDAVKWCGLSRAELYRRMTRGELRYVIRGRRRLIPRRALSEMLAAGLRGGRTWEARVASVRSRSSFTRPGRCEYCGGPLPPRRSRYCSGKHAANDRREVEPVTIFEEIVT